MSGGGDSVALLALAVAWGARPLAVATVDHGLRPGGAAEAASVSALSARFGLSHATLRWDGWAGGNLQARARAARRRLLSDWAASEGLAAVLLAHTRDDQAETVLMRLARGSGVDGLAAMRPAARAEGVLWLRPLLGATRAELRDHLRALGLAWAEDPGNADARFARIAARRLLPALAPLGLTPARLATLAAHMGDAAEVLDEAEAALARRALRLDPAGWALLDPGAVATAPRGVALRLLADTLAAVAGAPYRPRLDALRALAAALVAPEFAGATLHGCVLRPARGGMAILRELAAVEPPVPASATVWDGRWSLALPPGTPPDWRVGAHGAGLPGVARRVAETLPALWNAGTRVALLAPLGGPHGRARFDIRDARRRTALTGN